MGIIAAYILAIVSERADGRNRASIRQAGKPSLLAAGLLHPQSDGLSLLNFGFRGPKLAGHRGKLDMAVGAVTGQRRRHGDHRFRPGIQRTIAQNQAPDIQDFFLNLLG
jgi:hypothetical protein